MKSWIYLGVAIISEIVATSALKSSNGLSRLWPSVLVVCGYGTAFYFLSLTLSTMPVGIAYAIWAGIGIVLVTLIGFLVFNQKPDAPALLGIGLIVAGVVIMNIFSKTIDH